MEADTVLEHMDYEQMCTACYTVFRATAQNNNACDLCKCKDQIVKEEQASGNRLSKQSEYIIDISNQILRQVDISSSSERRFR